MVAIGTRSPSHLIDRIIERCLVREAGGTIEPAPGGPWPPAAGTLLVTNGHIRDELAGLMEPEQKQERRAGRI